MANTSPYGEKPTTWYNVSFFGNNAEKLEQFIKKGVQVICIGEVLERTYQGKDGERRSLDFRAQTVQLVPRGTGAAAGGGGTSAAPVEEEEDNDDIPF
jgi:single-strand DNA-binding protein